MIIPSSKMERENFVQDKIRKCFMSVDDRKPLYDLLKRYYLFGSNEAGIRAIPYNIIRQDIEELAAFLFAGQTTNLYADVHTKTEQEQTRYMRMGERAVEHILYKWYEAEMDTNTDLAVEWSLVYGTMFKKIIPKRVRGDFQVRSFLLEPHSVGVLNEQLRELERQEVICHRYYESEDEVKRILRLAPDLSEESLVKIMSQIQTTSYTKDAGTIPEGLNSIIISSMNEERIEGHLGNYPLQNVFDRPVVTQDMVDMYECWIWDDAAHKLGTKGDLSEWEGDYRRFVYAGGQTEVLNSCACKCYVKGDHPFVKVTPKLLYDYFWGFPISLNIMELQNWHTDFLYDIRKLLKKALDPPIAFAGMLTGMLDEKAASQQLSEPRGFYHFGGQGKAEAMRPNIPSEAFGHTNQIESYAHNMMGLQDVMQGKGTPGVRSKGHAELLSAFGSAKLKKLAMRVEISLGRETTLIYKLGRKYDKTHLSHSDIDGEFTLGQMPEDMKIKIDAHSSSPIFVQELMDITLSLSDRQIIDPETTIQLMRVPMKPYIKHRMKEMLAKRQQMEKDALKEAIKEQLDELEKEQKEKLKAVS